MKYFAICENASGDFECINITNQSASAKYKELINNSIKQLDKENTTRVEQYKIVKFVSFVEHENGFSPHSHIKWSEKRCEEAKNSRFPIFDFQHPENGIEY